MAPKLISCDVFGMLLKYGLSAAGGFGGGEKLNPAGVLVSGIGLLSLLVPGGDITRCCGEFCTLRCLLLCYLLAALLRVLLL